MQNDQLHRLEVSVPDIPSEELFDTWQVLVRLRVRADAYISQVRTRFDQATNLAERERLWARLEVLWPSYQVLSAWTDVVHAARVRHRGLRVAVHGRRVHDQRGVLPVLSTTC
jgi:hypothetical protein